MNTKIIVCCHKDDIRVSSEPYLPVQVGKAISNVDLGIQGDDEGDNISSKNRSYCELTGLYWAWKNFGKDVEVVGLCHYRRYFDFHNQCLSILPYTKFTVEKFSTLDFSVPDSVLKSVKWGKVIVPRPMNNVGSLYDEYCITHISEDLRTLEAVIKEKSDANYAEAFDKVMHLSHKPYCFNMFLMGRDDFDKYCSWLFDILQEVERRVDISSYSDSQKRIFGYMSERLFNVFLAAENKKVIKKPLIFIMDGKQGSRLIYFLKSILNDVSFFLSTLYLKLQ